MLISAAWIKSFLFYRNFGRNVFSSCQHAHSGTSQVIKPRSVQQTGSACERVPSLHFVLDGRCKSSEFTANVLMGPWPHRHRHPVLVLEFLPQETRSCLTVTSCIRLIFCHVGKDLVILFSSACLTDFKTFQTSGGEWVLF